MEVENASSIGSGNNPIWLCHIMVDGIERLLMEERNGMLKQEATVRQRVRFALSVTRFLLKKTEDLLRTILIPTSDDIPYNSVTLHCPHFPTVPSSLKTPSRKLSFQQMNLWDHTQAMFKSCPPIFFISSTHHMYVWYPHTPTL